MKTEILTITPALAASLLASSNGNRPTKAAKVQAYARDMASGRWMTNGESIIIDVNGSLIDGHHRLKACVSAELPFQSIVVWGAPTDAQKTIDMGASRSSSDALSFYGHKNTNQLVCIVRTLMSICAGRARSANPSTQEVFAFIAENPDVEVSTSFAMRHKKIKLGISNMLGAIHFIASRDGKKEAAERFADVLETGIPAYQGCAAHALRERLMKDAMANARLSPADRQLLVLSAWEKFKVSAPVKTLKAKATFQVVGMTRKEA